MTRTIRLIRRLFIFLSALMLVIDSALLAQDTAAVKPRPFVAGGIYDKPFITRLGSKTTIGGYMDVLGSFHREDGVNEGWSFEARRFNLFTYSVITEGIVVASEIEMEHGGEESADRICARWCGGLHSPSPRRIGFIGSEQVSGLAVLAPAAFPAFASGLWALGSPLTVARAAAA